ncbi:hypothetical protein BpHYR1_023587 [Brachionus plicatilis]|uniref:Uncharacterized protein n=1 Tax=Brachionus plicatilis TaxID=10195 RepID=A0A3M7TBP4_BRAPC|nr:hypothetical protein BpHYR1_023587 [Brachionus plicatilis]
MIELKRTSHPLNQSELGNIASVYSNKKGATKLLENKFLNRLVKDALKTQDQLRKGKIKMAI